MLTTIQTRHYPKRGIYTTHPFPPSHTQRLIQKRKLHLKLASTPRVVVIDATRGRALAGARS